jgi:hypothetical protein
VANLSIVSVEEFEKRKEAHEVQAKVFISILQHHFGKVVNGAVNEIRRRSLSNDWLNI